MRKSRKLLALILSMVNVLGLSKSNANPKGESKKDAVVNKSKDKNMVRSKDFENDEAKNKLKRIFSEYNLVTKRNVLDLLLVVFGGGYIYKQRRNINLLNSKLLEVKQKSVENKPLMNPGDPLEKDKNNLDQKLKKFFGKLAEKVDQEFEEYVGNKKIVDDDGKGVFYDYCKGAVPFIKSLAMDYFISEDKKITFDEYRKFGGKSNRFDNDWQYFCRKEKAGNEDEFKLIDENHTGWKIHISPDTFNCTEVFKLVYESWCDKKFSFKFIRTPQIYRGYNWNMIKKNQSYQVGKYITIYPKNDEEAKEIVESLHAAFEKKGLDDSCFLEISDDFKVYPGIYVRMSEFSGGLDDGAARGKLCIPAQVFNEHCKSMNIETENYQHPFDKLYAHGEEMPKKVGEINTKLKAIEKK